MFQKPCGIDMGNPVMQSIRPSTGLSGSHGQGFSNPGVMWLDAQRNQHVGVTGNNSHYVEAIIKGPRLEIPVSWEDALNWLKQCENFFYEISRTPADQWVNLATAHFHGRAATWLKNTCIPWQMIFWLLLCNMVNDQFSTANTRRS